MHVGQGSRNNPDPETAFHGCVDTNVQLFIDDAFYNGANKMVASRAYIIFLINKQLFYDKSPITLSIQELFVVMLFLNCANMQKVKMSKFH